MEPIDESPFFPYEDDLDLELFNPFALTFALLTQPVNMDASGNPVPAPAALAGTGPTAAPIPSLASVTASTPALGSSHMTNSTSVGTGQSLRERLVAFCSGWVRRAMFKMWQENPKYPLTYIGEFLIASDIKYHGAPADAQDKFVYFSAGIPDEDEEHEETAATTTDVTATSEQQGTNGGGADATTTASVPKVDGATDVNGHEHAQVNGVADLKADEDMQDA